MTKEKLFTDLKPDVLEAIANEDTVDGFGSDGFYYELHNYNVIETLVREDTESFRELQEAKRILKLLEDVYEMVSPEC